MRKVQLIEYRPNRWIKVDQAAGVVIGQASPQEVKDWLATHGRPGAGSPASDETPAPEAQPAPPEKSAPQKPAKPAPANGEGKATQGPVQPLAGRCHITSTFADHQNRTPPSSAPGLDFACAAGSEVRAWAAGRVIRSRWSDGGGRSLWLDHGRGIRTYYAHLDGVFALEGEVVAAGQKIGESGSTGHSTGPHLHFSVMRSGQYVDPARFLPAPDTNPV